MSSKQAAPADDEAVSRVRKMMIEYVDRLAERLGYIRLDHPADLPQKVKEIGGADATDAVLTEVRLAVARHPERLSSASSDAEVARYLYGLLEAAVSKVERDQRDSRDYAQVDPKQLDPDPSFRRGSLKASTKSWE